MVGEEINEVVLAVAGGATVARSSNLEVAASSLDESIRIYPPWAGGGDLTS